jgi:signal transduction histidine kinase
MTAVPAAAIVLVVVLFIATERRVLRPMTEEHAELRELDRLKDEFVAVVSHELRTPLTAIRGALQLVVASDQAVPDPEYRQLVAVALRSAERLVRIVNDILDISKIEAGRMELHRTPLDLASLTTHAVNDVRPVADEAGVAIEIQGASGRAPVSGDADRLTQALVNLLSNAVKAAPRGSAVTVRVRDTGAAVAISVADRGHGIAEADLSRLFRKFQQLEDPATRRTGGTGLGLAITKAIVEQHGGTIGVRSAPGEGTTFTITIPRPLAA